MEAIPPEIAEDVRAVVENGDVLYTSNAARIRREVPRSIRGDNGGRLPIAVPHETNLYDNDFITRREVQGLKERLMELSKVLNESYSNPEVLSDYESLIAVVNQEQAVYQTVFDELTRQVSVQMRERGDVLRILRDQYAGLFEKIPRHVKSIYVELGEHKALNHRMKLELFHARNTLESVLSRMEELNISQWEEGKEDLVADQPKKTDPTVPMKKYLDVYSLRLERLETNLRQSEEERVFWMDGVKHMILKFGKENRMTSLIDFHRCEQNRYLDVNTKLGHLHLGIQDLFKKIEIAFHSLINGLSSVTGSLEIEDLDSLEVISRVRMEMITFYQIIPTSEKEAAAASHLMENINKSDAAELGKKVLGWIDSIQKVSNSYGPEHQFDNFKGWEECRKAMIEIEAVTMEIFKIFAEMPEKKEFQRISTYEQTVVGQIMSWLNQLKLMVNGESELLVKFVWLQNQLDDSNSIKANDPKQGPRMLSWIRVLDQIESRF